MAADLDALRGPLTGHRQLPLHLDASARAVFDFAVAADREQAYHLVLLEAGTVTDLEQWLDGSEMLRLWPHLYLPRVVRAAWQDRQPALAVSVLDRTSRSCSGAGRALPGKGRAASHPDEHPATQS